MMSAFYIDSKLIVDPPVPVFPHVASFNPSPICVGGVGGSGTRVVAEILEGLEVFIGNNLNQSKDNLDIRLNQVLDGINDPVRGVELIWRVLKDFEKKMNEESQLKSWGWKMPGNFYWLDYLSSYFPKLRYIHVIRDGVDMAYSSNQNQIRNWGSLFGVDLAEGLATPAQMLDFWITVNNFAINKARKRLENRVLLVKFDELCVNPVVQIDRVASFLGKKLLEEDLRKLASIVKTPKSVDRYKRYDIKKDLSDDLLKRINQMDLSVQPS